MEPATARLVREPAASFSPLPLGEVDGTRGSSGRPAVRVTFSPLPLGEVDGTATARRLRSRLHVFQSPTARGSRWNTGRPAAAPGLRPLSVPYRSGKSMEHGHVHAAARYALALSVPYRSGKSMEPTRPALCRPSPGAFSPLPLGEVDGTSRSRRLACARRHLSVPYRSGKSMEPPHARSERRQRWRLSVPYRSGKSMELRQPPARR